MDTQVEIVGNADGNAVVQSPITKTPCVLWQIEVQELRKTGKNSHWVTVHSNKSTSPFDVYDASGKVLLAIHGLCLNEQHWLRDGHRRIGSVAAATG